MKTWANFERCSKTTKQFLIQIYALLNKRVLNTRFETVCLLLRHNSYSKRVMERRQRYFQGYRVLQIERKIVCLCIIVFLKFSLDLIQSLFLSMIFHSAFVLGILIFANFGKAIGFMLKGSCSTDLKV